MAAVCPSCGASTNPAMIRCGRCGAVQIHADAHSGTGDDAGIFGRRNTLLVIGGVLVAAVALVSWGSVRSGAEVVASPIAATSAGSRSAEAGSSERLQATSQPVSSLDLGRAGVAAYSNGQFHAALERFEEAVAASPNDPVALNNLGQALVRVGRAQDAVPHLLLATALNPREWAPRFNLAHAYGELAQWSEAVTEYEKSAELFPDDYVTQFNLGLALHKTGREEPAVAAFQRAISLAPGEPSFHLALGISYERLDDKANAARAFETYLEMLPTAPDAEQIRSRIQTLRAAVPG